jgi:hypothetical protein
MKQNQQVVEAMKKLGGFATFGKLNHVLGFLYWKTTTPLVWPGWRWAFWELVNSCP